MSKKRRQIGLDSKETAEMLGVHWKTLSRWRYEGGGPPFHKIGHRVYYMEEEIREWFANTRRMST